MPVCADCGTKYRGDAEECSNCGSTRVVVEKEAKTTCPDCGHRNRRVRSTCEVCGTGLQ